MAFAMDRAKTQSALRCSKCCAKVTIACCSAMVAAASDDGCNGERAERARLERALAVVKRAPTGRAALAAAVGAQGIYWAN